MLQHLKDWGDWLGDELLEKPQSKPWNISKILRGTEVGKESMQNQKHVLSRFNRVQLSEMPWTVAHQAPLVQGILQARILEWVAISFCRGSSWPRDQTWVSCGSCIAGRFLTAEPPGKQNWRQKWQIEWREPEDFLARLYLKVWKYEWKEAVFLLVKTGSGLHLEGEAKLVLNLRVGWL